MFTWLMGKETGSVVLSDLGWDSEVVAKIMESITNRNDEVDTTFSVVLLGTIVPPLLTSERESNILEDVLEVDEEITVSVMIKLDAKIEVELDTKKVVSSAIELAEDCVKEVDTGSVGTILLEDWIVCGDDTEPLVSLGEGVLSTRRLISELLVVDVSRVTEVLL